MIGRENCDDHPLLKAADRETASAVVRADPVPDDFVAKLQLRPPVPRHPRWVDFHNMPEPVISAKIVNVLRTLELPMVQLLEAQIEGADGEELYHVLHVMNLISCLDRERSSVATSRTGAIIEIERLVLDEQILEQIPEQNRKLFILEEDTSVYLVEKGVAELIMDAQPVGLKLYHTSEWHGAIGFE